MEMVIDVLDKKIKEMKDLRQREERRDNKAAQDAIDLRFKTLTDQIHKLVLALQFTKTNMKFQLSDQVLDDLNTLLVEHKETVRSGYADKDAVTKSEGDLKTILSNVRKEWSKQYAALTNATVSTLKVIAGIDSDQVSKCLAGIARGEAWTVNVNEFAAMNKSLSDANTLIAGLGLDNQIISFLQKMNGGKATVVDLDEKVLKWLKDESLDKRVKLSFGATVYGKKL